MTNNADIFQRDPESYAIPNNGVAEVINPSTRQQWDVLHYELESFVCKGEYENGLQQILSTYIDNFNKTKQPAVWVSGFYGSGKSHFVRVLEYLWRDTEFPDGVRARALAHLTPDISDSLKELSTVGRREGGLWSAAGTLGAGNGKSVRLALLSIIFRSAGLPEQFAPARFVIWLKQNNFYRDLQGMVEQQGKDFARELNNLYVSSVLAQGLLELYPDMATTTAEVRNLIREQYPRRDDVSDEEMLQAMEDVLDLQSTTPGKRPCMLLICDELQQFIGDDSLRTLHVQTVVEACSSRFGNHLLFVATGQASIQATPQLQKLQGRFTVRVTLTDTDVEQVVREVVLSKKPTEIPALQAVLDAASGEINRHLAGTKIRPRPSDAELLVADYPLLPVRNRFWEHVLRAVDDLGAAGQLRTQLRIVHDTLKDIAQRPLGTVVTGDMIYYHLKTNMLHSNILLRDMSTVIDRLDDGTTDGKICSRLCATIFLIGKLPTQGVSNIGLLAENSTLSDLLVDTITDVSANSELRQKVPVLLQSLVEQGTLMQVGNEYRLQTRESAEWETDYQRRRARIRADDARIASDRTTAFTTMITALLKNSSLPQGQSKTVRKIDLFFNNNAPPATTNNVPVWIRDEWTVSEKTVRMEAQAAGSESPVVFVFLPQQEADALKDALASYAAALETVQNRHSPLSDEGKVARQAMESKRQLEQDKRDALMTNIINNARVYQGGGNDIAQGSLQSSVRVAFEAALERLFPKFTLVDHTSWNSVITRSQQGSGAKDALSVIGYHGDIDKYPACQEIRLFINTEGKKGSEIRKHFMGIGYGWPQDAIDGTLLCLMVGDFIRAAKNGQRVLAKQITIQQIGQTDFYNEGITITTLQRIGLRKLLQELGLPVNNDSEILEAATRILTRLMELVQNTGGDAPLPERPASALIENLRSKSGNGQLLAIYEQRETLLKNFKAWTLSGQKISERLPQWQQLQKLLNHAQTLPIISEITSQSEAIKTYRTLLQDPDPVFPLLNQVTTVLRQELITLRQHLQETQESALQDLQSSAEWQSLRDNDQSRLLRDNALGPIVPLHIGTNEELLTTLNTTSLSNWNDKIAAIQSRAQKVREEVAKILTPEKQSIAFVYPHATLQTKEEIDTYLAGLRTTLMNHIEAGHSIII